MDVILWFLETPSPDPRIIARLQELDNNDLHTPPTSSTSDDLFQRLPASTSALRPLGSVARAATEAEKHINLPGSARSYLKAIGWSVLVSSTLIMEGFDTLLIFSYFSLPAFKRKYGEPAGDGSYEIPTRWQFGLTTAAEAGEIVGLLFNGILADRVGYRATLLAALTFLFLSIFVSFFATSIRMLLAAQILCGLPWGVFQTLTINYAAELMPVKLRAYLLSGINLCWVLGQILSSGVVRAFVHNNSQWAYRIPFALQWAIGVPIFIGVLLGPESPWWWIRHKRPDRARQSLRRLTRKKSGRVNVDQIVSMMIHTDEVEKYITHNDTGSISYLACFRRTDLRRTEIACVVWITQQVCGTSLVGWAAYFYEQAGLNTKNSYNLSVGTFGLAILGYVVCFFLLARVGRRRLYLVGLFALAAILVAVGALGVPPKSEGLSWALGCLLLLVTFVYNITIGPICYVLVAEIPSTRLRVKTVVLARVAYNLSGILINWITPQMVSPEAWNWRGKAGFVFAGTTICCFVYCYWRLPETFGLSYLEIDILFAKKAKPTKFREVQCILERSGYYDIEGYGREEQCPFQGY
ncbi:putative MFS sugar transporter [Aspergillus lucknowensis]|uniref:Major facilitator superfamily (MFS) profile domain-containing protein n=1 Tax=Aspergillus lucknowensis TaxID=176173 RepID=A0ABR4LL18_9EURO